jgi:hypothetical protein
MFASVAGGDFAPGFSLNVRSVSFSCACVEAATIAPHSTGQRIVRFLITLAPLLSRPI